MISIIYISIYIFLLLCFLFNYIETVIIEDENDIKILYIQFVCVCLFHPLMQFAFTNFIYETIIKIILLVIFALFLIYLLITTAIRMLLHWQILFKSDGPVSFPWRLFLSNIMIFIAIYLIYNL